MKYAFGVIPLHSRSRCVASVEDRRIENKTAWVNELDGMASTDDADRVFLKFRFRVFLISLLSGCPVAHQ